MSDYLQRLNEEHKERMRKLWRVSDLPKPSPKRHRPKRTWERCVDLIASTYEHKVGRSKYITTPITREDILSDSHRLSIVRARDIAIYLTRMSSKLSTPQIGKAFNRDHSTIWHSIAKVQALINKSPVAKEEIEKLLAQIGTPKPPPEPKPVEGKPCLTARKMNRAKKRKQRVFFLDVDLEMPGYHHMSARTPARIIDGDDNR